MRIRERDGKDFDVPVFDLDSDGSVAPDDAGLMTDHVVDDAGVYPRGSLRECLEVPVPSAHDDDDLETLAGICTPDKLPPRGPVETSEKTERPPRRETILERDTKKALTCFGKPPPVGGPLEAAPLYAGKQAGWRLLKWTTTLIRPKPRLKRSPSLPLRKPPARKR